MCIFRYRGKEGFSIIGKELERNVVFVCAFVCVACREERRGCVCEEEREEGCICEYVRRERER